MTSETILALATLISVSIGVLSTIYASRRSARKDDVQFLREEIVRLQKRVAELEAKDRRNDEERRHLQSEIAELRMENTWLRSVLLKNGIEIPKMPKDWI